MLGCNRNDKVVGTFRDFQYLFKDLLMIRFSLKLDHLILLGISTITRKIRWIFKKLWALEFFEILADNRNVK